MIKSMTDDELEALRRGVENGETPTGLAHTQRLLATIAQRSDIARDLYDRWEDAVYQLDDYFREKHGHNEGMVQYSGAEFDWLKPELKDPPPRRKAVCDCHDAGYGYHNVLCPDNPSNRRK